MMGKRDKQNQEFMPGGDIRHYWDKKPAGMMIQRPSRWEVAGMILLVIIVCVVGQFTLDIQPDTPTPPAYSYEKVEKEPSPILSTMILVFIGAMTLLFVVGTVTLIAKLGASAYESITMARIRVDAARVQPKADNGHLHIAKDGTVSDLEASPSRKTTKGGYQPVPESPGHAAAVEKTRMAEMVRTAGGGAQLEWEREEEPPFQLTEGRDNQKWGPILENDNR